MISVKKEDLFNLNMGLQKYMEYSEKNPVDFKINYRLAKISKKVESALKEYFEEKNELAKKHGGEETMQVVKKEGKPVLVEDDDGNKVEKKQGTGQWDVGEDQESFKKYKDDLDKLLKEKVELTNVFTLKTSDLQELKMPFAIIYYLFSIIEEEKEEHVEKKKKTETKKEKITEEA